MQAGGQTFSMPTGRLDGLVSNKQDAENMLPSTSSSATDLTQKFAAQGLNQDEMITLSGCSPHSLQVSFTESMMSQVFFVSSRF